MSTPGLPDVNEQAIEDDQKLISYASFRRQTLLRYLEGSQDNSPELKAKLLDWKPEVLENKTRHQTTKAREVTAYKEIFGSLPGIVKKPKPKASSSKPKKPPKEPK